MTILRTTLPKLTLLALAAGFCVPVSAQNLDMDVAGGADDGRPRAGMSQSGVEAKFGAPVTKISPVGEPPIARWEYQDFIVYFEYDKVIHAVRKR